MKRFLPIVLSGLALIMVASCGTATSITKKDTYLQYATVYLNDSIRVSGQLVHLNDSTIALSVAGAYAEYPLQSIQSYEQYTAPNPALMQRDVVINSARSTSHSGFFVAITIVSLVATAMIVVGQIL